MSPAPIVLKFVFGGQTTVLNFGFGSRTTGPNFRLGSRTTLRQDSDLSIKGYSLLQEVCINLQIQIYASVLKNGWVTY